VSQPGSFYITTPIFYVNDVPHIGHAYTEVAADVLARWHRQSGDDTWLLTGTDEHGQKILRTATANGVTPREWADRLVESAWKPLLATIDIANDDFIRTTDERHETAVAKFFEKLQADGHIYTGEYEGYYCVGCEEYKQLDDLDRPEEGEFAGVYVCKIHSRPVEILKEKNYFFRMSAFQDRLLELYRQPGWLEPESVRNEIVQFVSQGLEDLSISRSSFDWGVKVPWDESHVIYVWVDALLNYITAIGWGSDDEQFARRWPAQHLVGKDIARFHAVIWPAMLMAAGLEVPKGVFGHGWLLVGGEKMSKSKLTGIAPAQITDVFGSDAFRYYFLSAITFGQDGSFSWEDLSARYQAELANGFGNLGSRVIAMIEKYRGGVVPTSGRDAAIVELEKSVTDAAHAAIGRLAIHEALAEVEKLVDALNGYVTDQAPWVLAKDPAQASRLDQVLATLAHGVGTLAVLYSPVMPKATQKRWVALGEPGELLEQRVDRAWDRFGGGTVSALEPLFPRIELGADDQAAPAS
jgi:methionyl-tRNA synthetase